MGRDNAPYIPSCQSCQSEARAHTCAFWRRDQRLMQGRHPEIRPPGRKPPTRIARSPQWAGHKTHGRPCPTRVCAAHDRQRVSKSPLLASTCLCFAPVAFQWAFIGSARDAPDCAMLTEHDDLIARALSFAANAGTPFHAAARRRHYSRSPQARAHAGERAPVRRRTGACISGDVTAERSL